jgi:hypothetical protein
MRLGYVLVVLALVGCGAEPRAADGPQLYFVGDGEMWVVDAAHERVRHERSSQLKPGDPPHRVLARGNRVVMGTPYGDSAFFLPSARRDRVWVVDLRSSSGTAFAVREVTVDGETTVAARRTPNPRWPLGAVRDGLLLESAGGIVVWDPASGRTLERIEIPPDEVSVAAGDTVAACDNACGVLRLIDVDTLDERLVRAPPGYRIEPWTGAFSPDGDLLAVTVHDRLHPATAARELALIDVATGRIGVVPESGVPTGYTMLAWSAAGTHVFLTGGKRFERRVVVGYRVGTRTARRLDVELGDFYDLAAT